MNFDQIGQVEDLARRVLPLGEAERHAFLAEIADASLRQRVVETVASTERSINSTIALPLDSAPPPDSSDVPTLRPGARIGPYEILGVLGVGGMGRVYRGRDTRLDRSVAIKLLAKTETGSSARSRFAKEARTVSALNHPNIVTLFEADEFDGSPFLVTELVEGGTLRQWLAAAERTVNEKLAMVSGVADGLAYAHAQGVLHRDIKPENVLVSANGFAKLADFGLAKSMPAAPGSASASDAQDVSRTVPGMILGTIAYMSPEQARGLEVDARSDIFSFGVLLYEVFAGQKPFQRATSADTLVAILSDTPAPIAGLPAPLNQLILQALEKDPARRFANMQAMKEAFDGLSARSLESAKAPAALSRRWLAPLVLAGVALAGGAWYYAPSSASVPDAAPHLADAKVTPLVGLPGVKEYAALSPDGTRVAFAWNGGEADQPGAVPFDIYVKQIGGGEPLRLTNTPEQEAQPVWSPDGRWVAFERRHDVIRVPAGGGPEEKIAVTGSGFTWSPDGKRYAVTSWVGAPQPNPPAEAKAAPPEPPGIILVEADGSRKVLTDPPEGTFDEWPVFSPDGQAIAFARVFGYTQRDIFVVQVSDKRLTRATNLSSRIQGLTWTPDSRELVFSGAHEQYLFRVAAAGGPVRRLNIQGQYPIWPSYANGRLAWSESSADLNIWQAAGPGFQGRPQPGPFGELTPILNFPRQDHSPEFSPDGQSIVFVSDRGGNEQLWLSDRQGRNLRALTPQDGAGTPHWSPDGRFIAFDAPVNGQREVFQTPVSGGESRRMTDSPSSDSQPVWSPDGHWIYFKSSRSGRGEIWRVASTGGPAEQVTRSGAFEGFVAPDGSTLYFTKGRGVYGIWAKRLSGDGAETLVPELKDAGYWRSWGVLPQGIYFVTKEPTPRQTIRFYSFATKRVTPLLTVDRQPLWWQSGLALSPDGKQLLYAKVDHGVFELMLAENFH